MVGVFKAEVDALDVFQLHIRGEDEPVNDVILRVLGVVGVIGLVEQTAGGRFQIVGEAPVLAGQNLLVERAGRPEVGMVVGVFVQPAGEDLVEVPAGDSRR